MDQEKQHVSSEQKCREDMVCFFILPTNLSHHDDVIYVKHMLFVSDLSLLLDAWLLCSGCCCPIAFGAADKKRADGWPGVVGGSRKPRALSCVAAWRLQKGYELHLHFCTQVVQPQLPLEVSRARMTFKYRDG